jgi:hypothetical protein
MPGIEALRIAGTHVLMLSNDNPLDPVKTSGFDDNTACRCPLYSVTYRAFQRS